MKYLKTIEEIKEAVNEGRKVFCDSEAYIVIKGRSEDYYITCISNQYTIGLHGKEGTKYENVLNGSNFFIKEGK